jgi:hypothetical protein
VRHLLVNKDVSTEVEEATALEAVTKRQPVKMQQTEKTMRAVVNCRVCELELHLTFICSHVLLELIKSNCQSKPPL